MAKTPSAARIRKDFPENTELAGIAEDVEKYASIAAVVNQEGGRLIVAGLVADIITGVESVAGGYKKLTHAELMGVCAGLKANMDMLRLLKNGEPNYALARAALADALKAAEA